MIDIFLVYLMVVLLSIVAGSFLADERLKGGEDNE